MKDVVLILLFLIVVVQLGGRLLARRGRKPIRGYLDMIVLTKDQKRQVEDIRGDFLPKVEGIRQSLRRNRLQLNDLLFTETPDRKMISEKSSAILALQAELEREVIDHILQEKELLSSEQKRQFYEVIRKEFEKAASASMENSGRGIAEKDEVVKA